MLAEDHTLMRAGLRALLTDIGGTEIVGEASNGHEALKKVETLEPDVVLLDITLPELNGLEVAKRVAKDYPRVRVIMLSMHQDPVYVRQALQAGAKGYLVKGADVPELELALRAVMRGDTYLSPAISAEVVGEYLRGEEASPSPLGALTPRQREILQLIAEGRTTKDIAAKLDLSVKTVESHRAELMTRLDIHDVAGLVRFAIRSGLISADTP
jgi:DNA-binding NarL/FixJ family response regulator